MNSVRQRQRRGLRNRQNYDSFMETKYAYLQGLQQRIEKLALLAQQGYAGEATVLACCYLDALGYFRYLPAQYQSKKTFIKFLLQYGHDKDLSRVSLPILGRRLNSTKNPQANRLLAWINACIAKGKKLSSDRTILRKFRMDFSDHRKFFKLIEDATVAGVFYDHVRSLGVHQGRILGNRKLRHRSGRDQY